MKISIEWLSDFVALTETDPQTIAKIVTGKIAEVDDVEVRGGMLRGVVVGKILALRKHPNADKLSLAEVQTDQGMRKIVCGGTNLREGMIIPVAHVGATVKRAAAGGETATIERVTIRGEESNGMICAAEELGLESRFPPKPEEGARPVMDLSKENLAVGKPLAEALGMAEDVVLHIDNHAITHRPDLFSHRGFARELVAAGLATWKDEKPQSRPNFPQTPLPFQCVVHAKKLMPRYCACLLHIDGTGETPDWMKRRLEAAGLRGISLPVDITNYVMLEIGVPLHSFDADDFRGDIHVRGAKKGEHITTLDGVDRALPSGAIVISDDEGIFDLLGIMGGLRSSTKETTRTVYLHAASLGPASIRRTIVATGHRTDAATVYEKGVPPVTAEEGFFRALQLFLELAPGARILSTLESVGDNGKTKPVTLSLKRLGSVLGAPIDSAEVTKILTNLGCTIDSPAAVPGRGSMKVIPPLWRLADLRGEHDLIEEVGRLHGYDALPPAMPHLEIAPPHRDFRLHALRDALKEERYVEVVPLSLVSPQLLARAALQPTDAVTITNPLGEETSLLHASTVPGLLEHAGRNLPLTGKTLQTFECAHVFSKRKGEWFECGLLIADRTDTPLKETPFLRLKSHIEAALRAGGWPVTTRAAGNVPPFGHPGRGADLFVNETRIGSLTEVHPSVRANFDLPARAAVATLDLTTLLALPAKAAVIASLPQFPAVTYDVTVTRTQGQNTRSLLTELRKASPLLESVEIADLFSDKPLDSHEYKLTLRFTYRAPDRTLTEDEAKREQEKAEKMLASA